MDVGDRGSCRRVDRRPGVHPDPPLSHITHTGLETVLLWIPPVTFATRCSHFMHRDRTNATPDHFKWPRLN